MKLVLFDVDGTLTLGEGAGTKCFFSAFESSFGVCARSQRLADFRESTDSGIAREILEERLARPVAERDLAVVREDYLASLSQVLAGKRQVYRPVPGAPSLLSGHLQDAGWQVGLATGNWQAAAAAKLQNAKVPEPVGGGFAEDGETRVAILRAAIRKMGACLNTRIVYVGDRPWDEEAALRLGVGFLGVGEGFAARTGAGRGVEDLNDAALVSRILDERARRSELV